MRLKFHKRRRSVVYGWILSYLLLMVIMVVLTGTVYLIARKIIEAEINSSNSLLLESIRDTIDRQLAEINDFSMVILSSAEIGEVNTLSEGNPSYYYKIYKAAQSLNNYKSFKDEFQNFYIYFGGIDRIMLPGTVNTSFSYYNNYIRRDDFSYRQWKEAVGRIYYGEYIALPHRDTASGKNSNLAFVRSVPFPSRYYSDVTNIVIMMNFDKLLNPGGGERDIAILDENNNIIVQSRPDIPLDADVMRNISGDHGIVTNYRNGRKEIISHIASREYGWKYITITPENVFWEKSFLLRLVIWGEIILGVAGMGMLSFFFVRRNYNILYEITSFVRSKMRSETIYRGNEFNYIRQVLTQSIEEKEAAESRLDWHLITLRANFFINLIEGNKTPVPFDEMLTSYNINFPHPYYGVIAVYINSVNSELWDNREQSGGWSGYAGSESASYVMAKIAVTNFMDDILNRNNTAYCIEFRGYILFVVNTPFPWQEFRETMEDDLQNARAVIAQDLDIDIYIAASGLYNSLEDIRRAYNEAQSSIDYVRIMGGGKTAFFEDIKSPGVVVEIYPFRKERVLLNHIRLSDIEAAKEVLDGIFLTDLLKPSVSHDTAHFVVMALTAQILRNISADEEEMNRLLDDNIKHIEWLNRCKTIIEMKAAVFQILKSLVNSENSATERKKQFSVTVQEYILKHYTDSLLCIESIAVAIGRSPYYISKKFKMETGGGILDFINKIRIEKAKIFLQDAMLTEAEIACRVGFTSVRTYQRIFKRMEGVTHSQFKQV